MKYFVSIENTSYFLWQIELLIESFKKHNIEDDLVIAVAKNSNPVSKDYTKNILSHKNLFLHENFGISNKVSSLWMAIENNLLPAPFAIIHPDMVLQNPIDELQIQHDICFSPEIETEAIYKEIIQKYISELHPNISEVAWLPVGDIITFSSNVHKYFFEKLNLNFNKLNKDFKEPNFKLEKAALILTIFEAAFGLLSPTKLKIGSLGFEQNLLHHGLNTNFIHYKHGVPPDWSKYQFKFKEPVALIANATGPYNALLSMKPIATSAIDYVCEIINSYKINSLV